MKILSAICCFLVVLSGAHVEARGHTGRSGRGQDYKLFVFGDSFVDTGNRPQTTEKTVTSRAWYYPYGCSDSTHGYRATGRFSNGLIQSDFVAKILGRNESPSPYRLWDEQSDNANMFTGVNFAVAGSGAVEGSPEVPTLRQQINQFGRLVDAGDIDDSDLEDSVALVAINGPHDYRTVNDTTSSDVIRALSEQVTDEIVKGVRRLQNLGVSKVLVNLVPPIGCQPWRSLSNGYSRCDTMTNMISIMHNTALKQKLEKSRRVLLLDLYTIFNNLLDSNSGLTSTMFSHKFAPCCGTSDPDGFCGQDNNSGRAYSMCPNPEQSFYWDYLHPTQAAWSAVMKQLQGPIQDFLGIDDQSW